MDDAQGLVEQLRQRRVIAYNSRRCEPFDAAGRRVRARSAPHRGLRPSTRELIEALEGLFLAIDVEELAARLAAVGSESGRGVGANVALPRRCHVFLDRRTRRRGATGFASSPLGQQRGSLGFPELGGALLLGFGLVLAAGSTQHGCEREACVGVIQQRIGGSCDVDGRACETDRLVQLSTLGQRLGAHAPPDDCRLQVVTGQPLALVRESLGLSGAILGEQGTRQQRRRACRVDA
jgi:hypothetical protein